MTVQPRIGLVGKERRCPMCKKRYIYHEGWVYRKGKGSAEKVFCSWKCLREWEKGHRSASERREMIITAIQDGLNDKEIAALVEDDPSKVRYWRRKLETEERKGMR